jgi:hypothetical protein
MSSGYMLSGRMLPGRMLSGRMLPGRMLPGRMLPNCKLRARAPGFGSDLGGMLRGGVTGNAE